MSSAVNNNSLPADAAIASNQQSFRSIPPYNNSGRPARNSRTDGTKMSQSMFSKAERVISPSASGAMNVPSLANLRKSPESTQSRFKSMAANRLLNLQKQHDRESYSHKFTMAEDALDVALKQKPASPRLINNKREFD